MSNNLEKTGLNNNLPSDPVKKIIDLVQEPAKRAGNKIGGCISDAIDALVDLFFKK